MYYSPINALKTPESLYFASTDFFEEYKIKGNNVFTIN